MTDAPLKPAKPAKPAGYNPLAAGGPRKATLTHRVEFAIVRVLVGFFRVLGLEASSWLAGAFCRAVGPLISGVSNRARANLALIYPHWSATRREAVLRGAWESLGRTAAEFAHLKTLASEDGKARRKLIIGDELEAYRDSGRPAIFVSGHFSNWEVLPLTAYEAGVDHAIVYRPLNNPLLDAFIIKERAAVMSDRQIPKGAAGLRDIFDDMRQGGVVAMLADQKLNNGVNAPFMGHQAMTAPFAARLALKFDALIVPATVRRHKGVNFTVTVHNPMTVERTGDLHQDVLTITTKINDFLGAAINEAPEQWLWFHRRWPATATKAAMENAEQG